MPASLSKYADQFVSMAMVYLPQALLALVVLVIGFYLVRIAVSIMDKALTTQRVDRTLAGFLHSMVTIVLKVLILITVAMMVGIQMTSFIAILGAASLAVGLSLQGSLSNLSGGILILFFKPFQVGDDIEAQGQRGTVHKIEIFSTLMKSADGTKMIIIPNGALSNSVIGNYSRK